MNWRDTEWNNGVKLYPYPNGIFKFQFPDEDGRVNYLTCEHAPVKVGQVISIKYRIKTLSGSPQFVSLDPTRGLLPNFRVMIAVDTTEARYWPQGTICGYLGLGFVALNAVTFRVPITADLWQDVNGKPATDNLKEFKQLVQRNMKIVALTFGGGNSFGHGVCVKGGKALFQLLEFSIK